MDFEKYEQQVHRQKDAQFIRMLEHLRWGRCPPDVIAMLKSRQVSAGGSASAGGQASCGPGEEGSGRASQTLKTRLMTHRADVERVNSAQVRPEGGEWRPARG